MVFVGFAEIYGVQKDADDRREARTHARDRRAIYPRAYNSNSPLFSRDVTIPLSRRCGRA
jgi:hypothetical protein